jgi:polysaccharide deacetylase 2 family uncharacterized protein YibQ
LSADRPKRRWLSFGTKGKRTRKGEPAGGAAGAEPEAPMPAPGFAQDIEDLELPASFGSLVEGLPAPPADGETQPLPTVGTPPLPPSAGAAEPPAPPAFATQPLPLVEAPQASGAAVAGLVGASAAQAAEGQTLGEFAAAQQAAQTAAGVAPAVAAEAPRLVSIADLARAHEEATVEQAIAREVARRRELRRRVVLTAVLAIVGTLIGSAVAVMSVSRQERTGGTLPKVGIQPGLGGSIAATGSVSPTGTVVPTSTAAQVCVVLLVDDSKETSANLVKFTQQRLPLTYAVPPGRTPFTSDVSQRVQANGGQSIVYQPVGGSGSSADGQPGEIKEAQSKRAMANRLIGNITGIIGNQGITPFGFSSTKYPYETVRMMAAISAKQNTILLEPQEGTRTALSRAAQKIQAKYAGTDVRLDAQAGEKFFRSRWDLALKRAEKNDRAVVVTRLTGLSARVLPPLLAGLDTSKFQLVHLSQLVP